MATGYRAVSKLGAAEPQYNIYIYIYIYVCVQTCIYIYIYIKKTQMQLLFLFLKEVLGSAFGYLKCILQAARRMDGSWFRCFCLSLPSNRTDLSRWSDPHLGMTR